MQEAHERWRHGDDVARRAAASRRCVILSSCGQGFDSRRDAAALGQSLGAGRRARLTRYWWLPPEAPKTAIDTNHPPASSVSNEWRWVEWRSAASTLRLITTGHLGARPWRTGSCRPFASMRRNRRVSSCTATDPIPGRVIDRGRSVTDPDRRLLPADVCCGVETRASSHSFLNRGNPTRRRCATTAATRPSCQRVTQVHRSVLEHLLTHLARHCKPVTIISASASGLHSRRPAAADFFHALNALIRSTLSTASPRLSPSR